MSKAKLRADAINRFIVDAKSQGVYDALKASCVMAGWDILAGALTPLAGTAPTNNGFLAADYDRGTGLKGDGTSYLDSNRANNADGRDDNHNSFFISVAGSTDNERYIGSESSGTGVNTIGSTTSQALYSRSRCNTVTIEPTSTASAGFCGTSRATSGEYSFLYGGIVQSKARASEAPDSLNIVVFGFSGPGSQGICTGRLCFYSIGTSVDLSVMDTLVSRLLSDFRSIDEDGMDRDALAYIRNVEAADGGYLELGVKRAIDQFVRGCKYDGIWDSIKASCILCGARTLAGALVPLAGAAPSNNNFVDADYNRETGLKGNGSSKYLDSGYAYAQNQDNSHMAIYRTDAGATVQNWIGAGNYNAPTRSFSRIGHYASGIHSGMQGPLANVSQPSLPNGFAAIERNDDENVSLRYNNVTQTQVVNSVSVSGIPGNFTVFVVSYSDLGFLGYSSQRAAFYSIGESISDLALLDTRVTTLVQGVKKALVKPNADAADWILRVEANGGTVSTATANAVTDFCNAIDAAGIRDRFYRLNLFCGNSDASLNAVRTPLYRGPSLVGTQYGGTTDTNNNFVAGDYAETGASGGLTGNGASKSLNTGIAQSTLSASSRHLAVYEMAQSLNSFDDLLGSDNGVSVNPWRLTTWNAAGAIAYVAQSGGVTSAQSGAYSGGGGLLLGVSPSETTAVLYRNGASVATGSGLTGATPGAANVGVFCIIRSGTASDFSSARLGAYSMGLSMDATQAASYNTALQAFQTALGRNV